MNEDTIPIRLEDLLDTIADLARQNAILAATNKALLRELASLRQQLTPASEPDVEVQS